MSDRRSHVERLGALLLAVRSLNETEMGSSVPAVVVHAVVARHGFGEAWFVRSYPRGNGGEAVVELRVENTEVPEFVLMRLRNNHMGGEPDFLWHAFKWAEWSDA